jgi:hypothetical protein
MWKIGLLITAVFLCLAVGNVAHAEQAPPSGPAASTSQPDQRTLERLRLRIPPRSKARCDSTCRRPITMTDKIFCCVTCLEAQWICREGSCFCEAQVPR